LLEPYHYLNNKRKHNRVPYSSKIEYCLSLSPIRWNKAYIINVSSGGLCLSFYEQLSVGQQIEIVSNFLPFLCSPAKVCWVKETAEGSYVAGLELCPCS
jgi:hypothetical protein